TLLPCAPLVYIAGESKLLLEAETSSHASGPIEPDNAVYAKRRSIPGPRNVRRRHAAGPNGRGSRGIPCTPAKLAAAQRIRWTAKPFKCRKADSRRLFDALIGAMSRETWSPKTRWGKDVCRRASENEMFLRPSSSPITRTDSAVSE